ncbi:probable fructokinase-7 [Andrographis paniculata]|uniref:probable fructokinase-7 n=1 Tax=Andrographis paniculata TaxID=175694 RepID=UPI0021E8CCAE|nr:probable fructokinase-7 [Andrographis paniculata]
MRNRVWCLNASVIHSSCRTSFDSIQEKRFDVRKIFSRKFGISISKLSANGLPFSVVNMDSAENKELQPGCCFPMPRKGSVKVVSDKKLRRSSSSSSTSSSGWSRRSFSFGRKIEKKETLVVCFGELLIDFVPTVSGVSLADAPGFKKAPGGAPANVAVAIARLGGKAAFIGKVGEDEFGYMLSDILKQNKVDNSGMRFDTHARTALAFVTLRDDGEREFMFFRHPSADMLLTEQELDKDLIRKARIFHYGSISLIDEPCRSTHLAAMEVARKAGCILSYDPNLRLPLWPSAEAAREGIMSIWNQADVIKISEDEITFLTDGADAYDDNVVLEKLYHPNLKLLVVTKGGDGCRYYTKAFHGRVRGVKVSAVDTTGAGDAFVGGLLNSLAANPDLYKDEKKLREVLFFANGCGGLTVTERGAIPALPTQEAVASFLEGHAP